WRGEDGGSFVRTRGFRGDGQGGDSVAIGLEGSSGKGRSEQDLQNSGREGESRIIGRRTMKRTLLFLAGCSLLLAAPPDLGKLEQALSGDPDSIRFGSEYRQAVIQTNQYDRSIKFF